MKKTIVLATVLGVALIIGSLWSNLCQSQSVVFSGSLSPLVNTTNNLQVAPFDNNTTTNFGQYLIAFKDPYGNYPFPTNTVASIEANQYSTITIKSVNQFPGQVTNWTQVRWTVTITAP